MKQKSMGFKLITGSLGVTVIGGIILMAVCMTVISVSLTSCARPAVFENLQRANPGMAWMLPPPWVC